MYDMLNNFTKMFANCSWTFSTIQYYLEYER